MAPDESQRAPLFGWPGWDLLLRASLLQLGVAACWVVLFQGADWVNGLHDTRVPIHLEAELSIPLLPGWTLVYSSLYLMFWMAPFILRDRRSIEALAFAMLFETVVAAIFFVVIPTETAFAPVTHADLGGWAAAFLAADSLNGNTNCVPSLHVAFAATCAGAFAKQGGGVPFGLWAAAIGLSTLFTHQHHLLDVATGFALAASGLHVARLHRLELPSIAAAAHRLMADLAPGAWRRS